MDSLDTLVAFVRRHSPFYGELYASVPAGTVALASLPIVDQAAFWRANTLDDNRVLTGPLSQGIVFKSGGTTGQPKFSVFTKAEWEVFTTTFGRGIAAGGIVARDRVANLFYVGELYASFIFIMDSLKNAPVDVMHFPLGGATAWEIIAKTIAEFAINVVAVVPTTVSSFASWLSSHGTTLPSVERILFGGEAMYADQLPAIARAFPSAQVRSIGYASVDAGLLGYADRNCGPGEHLPFSPETIIEIVDADTGEAIHEPGRAGRLLVTNLTRRLMPIIRYPAGDLAVWVDVAKRFRILGRADEGARVGPVTVYLDDLRRIIASVSSAIVNLQVVVRHHDGKDQLLLRLVALHGDDALAARIIDAIYAERTMLAQSASGSIIHPLAVEWVDASALVVNPRTGKLVRLLDERLR